MHQQNCHLEVWTIWHGSIHVNSESEDYYWLQIHVSGTQNLETNLEAYTVTHKTVQVFGSFELNGL